MLQHDEFWIGVIAGILSGMGIILFLQVTGWVLNF
jgi:hypothetical protein